MKGEGTCIVDTRRNKATWSLGALTENASTSISPVSKRHGLEPTCHSETPGRERERERERGTGWI